MKRRFAVLVLAGSILASVFAAAQQPSDQPNDQNGPPDLAAEVQQLKSEIDRLSRELERVSGELERMQAEHAAEEVADKATAQQAVLTPPAIAPAPTAPPAPTASPATPPKSTRGKGSTAKPVVPPTAVADVEEKSPTTMLVFRDGRKIEARNYAIVGQTVWVYTEQDSKRFPLADLNLEETRRANAERGVGFQLPPSR